GFATMTKSRSVLALVLLKFEQLARAANGSRPEAATTQRWARGCARTDSTASKSRTIPGAADARKLGRDRNLARRVGRGEAPTAQSSRGRLARIAGTAAGVGPGSAQES